jgi:cell wall-associated NlpC family hydrolase
MNLLRKTYVFAIALSFLLLLSGFSEFSYSYADENGDGGYTENRDIALVLNGGEENEQRANATSGFALDVLSIGGLTLDYNFAGEGDGDGVTTDGDEGSKGGEDGETTDGGGVEMSLGGYASGEFIWSDYLPAKERAATVFDEISGIKLRLTGSAVDRYDIYYRVKIEPTTGWLDWARNGARAGFTGFDGKKITNLKVTLLDKGAESPNGGEIVLGYKKAFSRSSRYITKKYKFYNIPYESGAKTMGNSNSIKNTTARKKPVKITQQAKTKSGVYVLFYYKGKKKGWININSFDQTTLGKISYKTVIKSYKKYTLYKKSNAEPAELAKVSSHSKGKKLNAKYKYKNNFGQIFFALDDGNVVYANNFITQHSHLKNGNKKVEKAIAVGFKLVKKSKYLWGGGRSSYWVKRKRFDCSSFTYYCYQNAGRKLGNRSSTTTYTQRYYGKKVKYANLKRGDLIFFRSKDTGALGHVGIYLGSKFFMHDSPYTDSGGVDIDSLNDSYWKERLSGVYRRVA